MNYKEADFHPSQKITKGQVNLLRMQWHLDPSITLEEATETAKELYSMMKNTATLLETHPLFNTLSEEPVSLEISPGVIIAGNETGLVIISFNEEMSGLGKKQIEFRRNLGISADERISPFARNKQIFPLKNTLELSIHSDPVTQTQVETAVQTNEELLEQLHTIYSFDDRGNFLKLVELPEGIEDARINVLKETPGVRLVKSPLSKDDLEQAEKALGILHYYLSS